MVTRSLFVYLKQSKIPYPLTPYHSKLIHHTSTEVSSEVMRPVKAKHECEFNLVEQVEIYMYLHFKPASIEAHLIDI